MMDKFKYNGEKQSKLPLVIAGCMIALIAVSYFFIPGVKDDINEFVKILISNDKQKIRELVSRFGFGGPLVLILIMVFQMFLFVVPNILVMVIAILIYGPFWGSVISVSGVFCSSTLGYIIGRYLGPVTVNKFIKKSTQKKISDFIDRYGTAAIAITRLASLSNDSLAIIAGLLKMSYKNYILATLAGITPLVVLLAIYGRDGRIEKALIWIAGISLVLLAGYVYVDKRRRQ